MRSWVKRTSPTVLSYDAKPRINSCSFHCIYHISSLVIGLWVSGNRGKRIMTGSFQNVTPMLREILGD